MKLKSFKLVFSLLIIFSFTSSLLGEEKIDIWENKKKEKTEKIDITETPKKNDISNLKEKKLNFKTQVRIESSLPTPENDKKVFGIYDPADYNFNINMWSTTDAEDLRASISRLKKIKLSRTSNEILENILMSFSYPPNGMNDKEFINLKINWLLENNKSDLIEEFLKQNQEFDGKDKVVQHLVDENIAQANIEAGCKKIKFIDKTIKDAYLEKFKIYCLIYDNKRSQAQLLLDILREQKQSDNFFDDKVNYLLGISEKTSDKVNEKNLLNFYLSSITIKNFKYEPTKNTKKEIWKYLNAANLIKLEDIEDESKIKDLELASNRGQIDKNIIFNIYKQKPFDLNTLINAKNVYQSLQGINSRSLIYQKFLLSEDIESKLEYLFLLEDLFKKDELINIFSDLLIKELKEIGLENMPENYKEVAENRISSGEEIKIGKIKYNDKVFHQSKIIKFYIENEPEKKIQKDIEKILKKISKNRKYFYSAKDLALVDSLAKDGFKIPEYINFKELASEYDVPKNLLQLINKKQNAFLALKIVEIIGEDEPYQLDPETIYFITNLLNEMDLIKIRNKVIISALPQRV